MFVVVLPQNGLVSQVSYLDVGSSLLSSKCLFDCFRPPPSSLQVKTEEQIAAEQAWYGSEKLWLVHKEGFSLGKYSHLELQKAYLLALFLVVLLTKHGLG